MQAVPVSNLPQAYAASTSVRLNQILSSYTRFNAQMVQIQQKLSSDDNSEFTLGYLSGIATGLISGECVFLFCINV